MPSRVARLPIELLSGMWALLVAPVLLLALTAKVHADPVLFMPFLSFGTGAGPISVAISDLNGDGRPDLAVANFNSSGGSPVGTVSVLLGNGDGTFAAKTDFGVGAYPSSVAIADFNADGRLDLAVAFVLLNTVTVMLRNASGEYGMSTSVGVPNPTSVAIADLNADGRLDLAVTSSSSNSVRVALRSGNGTFATVNAFATGPGPESVAIADLNADGKTDLAVANGSSNTVSVLLGNGSGGFAADTEFVTAGSARAVAIADLNADGRPDLAVASYGPSTVSVLLGNGDGTFAARTDFNTDYGPHSVAIADLNADGRPDLATGNQDSGTISVLLGNGDGTFAARIDIGTGSLPRSVAIADLNADGRPDLVAASYLSNTISVHLASPGNPTPAQMSLLSAEANPDRVVLRWRGEGAASFSASVYRRTAASEWTKLGSPIAEGADVLRYEDRTVAAGTRYLYRLGYQEGAAEHFTSEIDVDVPVAFRLALDGFLPNPAVGAPTMAFSLADDSPATIEVHDIAGRRVLRREVGGLGAGRHVIRLEETARLSPGVYLMRLRQAGRLLFARGVVVK